MTFKGKKVKFDWTNEDWAAAFLPTVRLAVASLEKDEKEFEEAIGKVMRDGIVPDLLHGLTNTKEAKDPAISKPAEMREPVGTDLAGVTTSKGLVRRHRHWFRSQRLRARKPWPSPLSWQRL